MDFVPASAPTVAAFAGVLGAVVLVLLWWVQRAFRSVGTTAIAAGGLALWLGLLSLGIASGRLAMLPLHGLPFFFGSIVFLWTALGLSALGRQIAAQVPLVALVGFQIFRLPLELILHAWAQQGTIPETMTWTGQNWDILSGGAALVAAIFGQRWKGLIWAANILGAVLLLNVMRVALLSSPVPFGWHQQPPLLLAYHLPYAFIGPICVGGALFGHIVLTRALMRAQDARS